MLHLSSGVVRERCHPKQPVGALLPTPTCFLKLFQNLWGNLLFSERVVTWKGFSNIGQIFLPVVCSQSWYTESPQRKGPFSPLGVGWQWSLQSQSVASVLSTWPYEGVLLSASCWLWIHQQGSFSHCQDRDLSLWSVGINQSSCKLERSWFTRTMAFSAHE